MDSVVPPELRRSGFLERFPEPTETVFRRWALERSWPSVRVILWISVFVWITNPLFQSQVLELDHGFPVRVYFVAWGVALPLVLVSALLPLRLVRGWMRPVILTLTSWAGLLCVGWCGAENTPALLLASAILFLFLAPVLQFPTGSTAISLVLVVPAAVVAASVMAHRDGTWSNLLSYELWLIAATSTYSLAVALVIERSTRGRFVDEHVIARQQEELMTSRALIRRYAPPAVADRIEKGDTTVDTAQRRRVTIFFADVVGFTTLADRLDPEALAEIVNDYLGSVAQIVETHGGTLNEFAGDGVMAIFGAPDELEPRDQVRSALAAARELQASLPGWSQQWYVLGIDQDLQARIGINTGVVSVGTFGSAVRATYTGIGLQTNIAARIQAQCDPGSVLLSKTSWHLVADEVPCRQRGEVEVKGVHFPIAMYEPAAD
ncbi:MAG: adenylate/guanylate cyclase domain-containing protein [Marmoricola sp.]